MPSIQTTKKRLHHGIFKAIVSSQSKALEMGIQVIDPCIFTYCLLDSSKSTFNKYYDPKKIDEFSERILSLCASKSKIKGDFSSLKVSKLVSDVIGKAYQDIDKIGPEHVFYMLIKGDNHLKEIALQYEIDMSSIVEMINKESRKKSTSDVFGDQKSKKSVQTESKDSSIVKYCIDFTQKARDGLLSPVFCRDSEMDQIITALLKKNKANPLLIGEPGVGKTALVEGLAKKFADGDVPDRLKGHRIISLPLASVIQGTTLRGQFEERLDDILKQAIADKTIILFIDEIHTVIGAGSGSEAGLDAGNIMKPYLARGDIKCIGATTFDDYYRHMRKDKALSRRFQRIFVSEPDESKTIDIIKNLVPSLESFHGCKVENDSVEYIVKLCKRFVADRFFPDKAIDCLDHSCAKSSLYSNIVNKQIVDQVVSELSDVPLLLVRKNDVDRMDGMEKILSSTVIGNDQSVLELCNRIRFCCSTRKTCGVLASIALYGPPGVGKKTLVYELAEHLYGKGSVISINGAEYSEPHSLSKLVGSPPGYVGHEEETFILREVRRKPHSVILIKNSDQMHSSVMAQFRQIFEVGSLTDVHGMIADFSNCIVIFSVDVNKRVTGQIGFSSEDFNYYESDFKSIVKNTPILKNSVYSIEFSDVNKDSIKRIVSLEMEKFERELKNSGIIIKYEEGVFEILSSFEGSPSEIRSYVREKLELSISEKITGKRREYTFVAVKNDVKVTEERDYESITVQS